MFMQKKRRFSAALSSYGVIPDRWTSIITFKLTKYPGSACPHSLILAVVIHWIWQSNAIEILSYYLYARIDGVFSC